MDFKIDTKEKMHVISIQENILTANMTEALEKLLVPYLDHSIKNIVINLKEIKKFDDEIACKLAEIQNTFYTAGHSMVICELDKEIQKELDEKDLLDQLNIVPTESEAWDMVQMEEIEREYL